MQAAPAAEEGKMLGDALNTVKIQVQQMKRHLVRCGLSPQPVDFLTFSRNWINSWMG